MTLNRLNAFPINGLKALQAMFCQSTRGGGSRRIQQSQVLPGLAISTLESALQQTRQSSQTQVGTWLLVQFQV
ncbi:MAG: hypothetical protein VKJ46_01160 [Leptolyngbyaceae bacterium]|nr:hypothetical protein [Leptolyngbyaceae bacterium]